MAKARAQPFSAMAVRYFPNPLVAVENRTCVHQIFRKNIFFSQKGGKARN
jgi:hypothetical protein